MEVEKKIDKEMTDVSIDVVSRFSKRGIRLKSLGKFGFVEGCIVLMYDESFLPADGSALMETVLYVSIISAS